MSFSSKLSTARNIVQKRAASRGIGAGRYASVSAFNQNDEGIWRNGTGDGIKPDRDDSGIARGERLGQLFTPKFGG